MHGIRKAELFREVNERIAELLEVWATAPGDFLCECGRRDCRCLVTMQLVDYRAIREQGGAVRAPHGLAA